MGDFASNSFGSFIAIYQELLWKEQRILIKYSYSRSDLSYENFELFGDNFFQRTFKDYNGQTYWISMNINSMFKVDNSHFPDWLNLALGHSAKDMISPNNTLNDGRYRQFFLSFDIDLMRIKSKNKIFNVLSNIFGYIKIPFPTIEYTNNQFTLHPIYF